VSIAGFTDCSACSPIAQHSSSTATSSTSPCCELSSVDNNVIVEPFRQRNVSAPVALDSVNKSANGDRRILGHHVSNNLVRAVSRFWAP
jgi:hypothetical protein